MQDRFDLLLTSTCSSSGGRAGQSNDLQVKGDAMMCGTRIFILFLCILCLPLRCSATALDDARLAHGAADFARAIDLYGTVVLQTDKPQNVEAAKLGIAACLFSLQQYDKAAAAFLAFASDYPKSPYGTVAIVHAGNVRYEQKRFDDADVLYERASREASGDSLESSHLWASWQALGKGRVLTAKGLYSAAGPYLLSSMKQASESRILDIASACLRQCAEAIKTSDSQAAQTWLAEGKLAEGRWRLTHEEYASAEPLLKDALKTQRTPEETTEIQQLLDECRAGATRVAQIALAESYEKDGAPDKAVAIWSAEAAIAPASDYAVQNVDRLLALCRVGLSAVQAEQALQSLAQSYPNTKLSAAAYLALGKLFLAKGNSADAIMLLKEASTLADKYGSVAPNIARIVAEKAEIARTLAKGASDKWPEAIAYWGLVSELETRPIPRGDALMSKGRLLMATSDYESARAAFNLSLIHI